MSTAADKSRLFAAIDERREELVELCIRAISCPSPNPPGDTSEIAQLVSEQLEGLGLRVDRYEPIPDAPSLVATMGNDGPRLVLNSHLDTFPAATGEWSIPPFEGRREDGRIYGCGATDMCAGLAASLFIATLLKDDSTDLGGQLTLTYSSDEETGGQWGTEWLLRSVPEAHGDACLIGDQNGVGTVAVGEKGLCWLRLSVEGQSSHAAYGSPRSATRELVKALDILYALEELVPGEGPTPTDRLERITVNVGRIAGGIGPNLVAHHSEAEIDVRIPVGMTAQAIEHGIRDRLATAGIPCELEILRAFDPRETDRSSRIVQAALQNAADVVGRRVRPVIRMGASDARFWRREGIPTVVYGPTPHNMGAPDEYVDEDELIMVAKVHMGIVLDYLAAAN